MSFSQTICQKQSLHKPSNNCRYLFGCGSKLQTWRMKRLPKKGFIEKVSIMGATPSISVSGIQFRFEYILKFLSSVFAVFKLFVLRLRETQKALQLPF